MCDKLSLNHFAVVATCMSLWILWTSALKPDKYVSSTVYTKNGKESVDLSCGENLTNVVAIYWSIYKSNDWSDILKMYPHIPTRNITHFENYTADKYGINESVNTSLVVKNIDVSDNAYFKCRSAGAGQAYSHITMLNVSGKSVVAVIQHLN